MRARLAAILAASALATTAALTATAPPAHASSPPRILEGLIDHWEDQIVADDHQLGLTGTSSSGIVGTFLSWSTVRASSGVNWANWVRARGGAPMLDLFPPGNVTLAQIAAGAQDSYLRSWADALAAWNHPFLLRLFPEMNGGWETYSPGVNHQTPAQFIAAWRHIWNLFRGQGASKVMFVWNPDRYFKGEGYTYAQLWPGSSYVNWVALDGYNWANSTHGTYWPYYLLYESVHMIRALPGASTRPLLIAEIGCAPYASKPAWIQRMYSDLQRLGAKAAVYFNENGNVNWRLDSSSSALSAARTAVHASNVVYHGRVSVASIDHLVATGIAPWS
jgi:hypothetical protein